MNNDNLQIDQINYKTLVDSIEDYAIFLLNSSGHIISWNKGAQKLKGYTENEIIGKHISIFYTPEMIACKEPETNLKRAKELGKFEAEGWRIRKNGSKFWANVTITALKNELGEVIGFGKVTRDMTGLKVSEDEIKRLNKDLAGQLRRSESEVLDYKHALDESSIVAITDQKGVITYVNDNFCKISKYSKEELIGNDHRIINSAYHSKDFIRELWTTIAKGNIWRGELRNKAKDGTYYWVDTTIIPFLNEKGKPYQYMAIRSDITQRKLAEQEIIQINLELERKIEQRTIELKDALEREKKLNEVKSSFVSMASHEFRTPLSTVLSSASLLAKYTNTEDQDKRNRHIEKIQSSVRHLNAILEDFLSLGKLEEGKVRTSISQFNLKQLLIDTIEELKSMIKNDQKIILNHHGNEIIESDEKLIRNILLNLLSNAIKFSPSGKNVRVNCYVNNEMTEVSVQDEGIGISKEDQEELFNSFFRAKNALNIQGTGLGLHIVKRYINLLNGNVHLESELGSGTKIWFTLPVKPY